MGEASGRLLGATSLPLGFGISQNLVQLASTNGGGNDGQHLLHPIKHLTLCRIEQRPPRLNLSAYPFLPGMEVKTTAAADYMALLGEAA